MFPSPIAILGITSAILTFDGVNASDESDSRFCNVRAYSVYSFCSVCQRSSCTKMRFEASSNPASCCSLVNFFGWASQSLRCAAMARSSAPNSVFNCLRSFFQSSRRRSITAKNSSIAAFSVALFSLPCCSCCKRMWSWLRSLSRRCTEARSLPSKSSIAVG